MRRQKRCLENFLAAAAVASEVVVVGTTISTTAVVSSSSPGAVRVNVTDAVGGVGEGGGARDWSTHHVHIEVVDDLLLVIFVVVIYGTGVVMYLINISVIPHVVLLRVLRFHPPFCLLFGGGVIELGACGGVHKVCAVRLQVIMCIIQGQQRAHTIIGG